MSDIFRHTPEGGTAVHGYVPTYKDSRAKVVLFGSDADSYYIGVGRRFFAEKMPPSLISTIQNMSAMQIAWISIDSNNEVWVLRNKYTSKFHFDTRLNRNIYEHLAGTNGKVKAKFVSFPVEKDPQWFIKLDNRGGWTAHMEQRYIDAANGLRKTVPNFDLGLTGILFGHEGSHIYQFERGFAYHLLGDSAEEDSLLRKTLEEFLDHNDPWCIQEGSTLCFYDSRYFFLQFKRPSGSQIQQRWCLPDTMAAKMTELVRLSETPEEREAMAAGEQAALAAAIARANLVHAKGAAVNRVLAAGQWY